MIIRSQLAVMNFNEGSKLEQATTLQAVKRYNLKFSKITKNWSSKPIKEKKDQNYLHKMVKETTESAAHDQRLENPILPSLPRNIASLPKPEILRSFKINCHVWITLLFPLPRLLKTHQINCL